MASVFVYVCMYVKTGMGSPLSYMRYFSIGNLVSVDVWYRVMTTRQPEI
jgi:hypothetical protein